MNLNGQLTHIFNLKCNAIFNGIMQRIATVKALTWFFTIYVALSCGYVSAHTFELSELDEQLSLLESKRTQSLQFVSDSLKELKPLANKMSAEQKYRYTLLLAHSKIMLGQQNEAFLLLKQQVISPFPTELMHYKARSLSLLSNGYAHYNHFADALNILHQLLTLLSEIDDIESEMEVYRIAIEIFAEMNMGTEALKYANLLYKKLDRLSSPRDQCFAMYIYADSIDNVYGLDTGKWEEIKGLYQKSFDICQLTKENMMMGAAVLAQSKIWIKRKQFVKAKELAQYGLSLASLVPYQYSMAEAHIILAQVAMGERELQLGVEELNKALDIALTLNVSTLLSKVYQPLAQLYEALGDTDKALAYLKLYQTHHSTILGETQGKIIAFEVAKLSILVDEHQIEALHKDLDVVKVELTKSQDDHQRLMLLFMISSLVALILFVGYILLKRQPKCKLA
ncbi:GGDEF domain-containing protein [Shewanella sp. VB17]|uniref:tetratricopeptide repeat protein n=1 Tax=Shewanella sp. VB17 TaxID=2739432 RepID=UPI0015642CF2|nr:GGDEF domain-containing protein [Shewanella sp. VB17]NRD73282.1 GGDEF domain-containing protein [Shewanella sp. VB17]